MESKSRYIALCQKLDAQERREKILDAVDTSDDPKENEEKLQNLQPVPDYEQLKRDIERNSLKVMAT